MRGLLAVACTEFSHRAFIGNPKCKRGILSPRFIVHQQSAVTPLLPR